MNNYMKLVDKIKEDCYYLFYCPNGAFVPESAPKKFTLLLHGVENREYIDHGRVEVHGFSLDDKRATGCVENIRPDCQLYELSDDEINYYVMLDNI